MNVHQVYNEVVAVVMAMVAVASIRVLQIIVVGDSSGIGAGSCSITGCSLASSASFWMDLLSSTESVS